MVFRMIRRSKKGIPTAKLSTSPESGTRIKGKFREVWSFIKQVWYVPFIWSLAWFSYWVFHDIITLGQMQVQELNFNYIGLAISIIAVFIAGYISGKSRKKNNVKTEKAGVKGKAFSQLEKTPREKEFQESVSSQYSFQETRSQKSEKLGQQLEHYSTIEKNRIEESNEPPIESGQALNIKSNNLRTLSATVETEKLQEIPTDCLICPNLTNCDQRQKRRTESETPCPYAKINLRKSTSESLETSN